MKIGIFSKLGANGGSEHRCAEMANGIARYTDHQVTLLCEQDLNDVIQKKLDPEVKVIKHIFKPAKLAKPDALYDFGLILVINSDSYSFAQAGYWEGTLTAKDEDEPKHHSFFVDLKRIPKMVFLFNFCVSPAQWIHTIAEKCQDVRIVVANRDYYHQIMYKDKLKEARRLPLTILESPIDPNQITSKKTRSRRIRIGKHSKAHSYKHNEDVAKLIEMVNEKHEKKVAWDFLGVPSEFVPPIQNIPNVTVRKEYSIPVGDYLKGVDIFLFYISWGRNEPWARAVAEGMMAGCPILATDKAGNRDQVVNGLNGYLCKSLQEFHDRLVFLIKDEETRIMMRNNNIVMAKEFTPDKVIKRFEEFVS